jgi:hypothetical protein
MIALVRPKRRKAHLAAEQAGLWLPLCDSAPAKVEGTAFLSIEAAKATVAIEDPSVCVYCLRMIAFVHILEHIDAVGGGRGLSAVA